MNAMHHEDYSPRQHRNLEAWCRRYRADFRTHDRMEYEFQPLYPTHQVDGVWTDSSVYGRTVPRPWVKLDLSMVRFMEAVDLEARVQDLEDNYQRITQNQYQSNRFRDSYIKSYLDEEQRELELRNSNPAVKAAWEQYQLMLNLAMDNVRYNISL